MGLLEQKNQPYQGGLLGDGAVMSSYTPTLREKVNYWLAENWYGDTREGVDKASKLSNVLETVTPYGLATMGYDAGRALGGGRPVEAGLLAGLAMAPLPAAAEKKAAQGIRAYHGSPHSFDKFSLEKIGTGEGAQVYGHGLYFADNESVAKSYRDTLSNADPSRFTTENAKQIAEGSLQAFSNDLPGALADLEASLSITKRRVSLMGPDAKDSARLQDLQEAINYLKEGPSGGSMYEVNINANPDDFLDWDKPLSEQPESVRKAISGSELPPIKSMLGGMRGKSYADPTVQPYFTGSDLVAELSASGAQAQTSERLKQAGIPGIKYLDAGSRGAGDGSRNYVVFDDKLIQIVKKYGIAGATFIYGADYMNGLSPEHKELLAQTEQMQEF